MRIPRRRRRSGSDPKFIWVIDMLLQPAKAVGRVAVALSLGLLAVALSPANASAEDAAWEEETAEFGAQAIEAAEIPTRSDAGARLQEGHLDATMRSGGLLDASEVNVAVVSDPTQDGGVVEFVWADEVVPNGAFIGRAERNNGDVGHDAFAVTSAPGSGQLSDPDTLLNYGANGYGTLQGAGSDLDIVSEACWSAYFTPSGTEAEITTERHHVYQCYEKIKFVGTADWAYNRWTITYKADTEPGTTSYYVDYEISTKPYAGYTGRVEAMEDMAPWGLAPANCQGTVSVGTGYVSFQTNVGCEEVDANFFIVPSLFGLDWDGQTEEEDIRLDAIGYYKAVTTETVLVFADRTYFEVGYSVGGQAWFEYAWAYEDEGWWT